jgi:hypothetical protein
MKSLIKLILILVIIFSFIDVYPQNKSSFDKMPYLLVFRYETPKLQEATLGTSLSVLAFGVIGSRSLSEGIAPKTTSDYGELIMYKFLDRAQKEIPNWPKMLIDTIPKKEYYTSNHYYILEFEVILIEVHGKYGFISSTGVTMKQPDGSNLWGKKYNYYGYKLGRKYTIKELRADNCKLLVEEIQYAADKTVSEFIDDFKMQNN